MHGVMTLYCGKKDKEKVHTFYAWCEDIVLWEERQKEKVHTFDTWCEDIVLWEENCCVGKAFELNEMSFHHEKVYLHNNTQ